MLGEDRIFWLLSKEVLILNRFLKEMGAFDHHPITISPTTDMDVNRSKHK